MNFGQAFTFVLQDKKWFRKLLIPSLYGLIPIIGVLILGGWGLKVTKKVIDGNQDKGLPKVDMIGDLQRGILASLIDLIYFSPAFIFIAASLMLFSARGSNGGFIDQILLIFAVVLGLIGLCLMILWLIIATLGFANYLSTGQFSAAFKFGELYQLFKRSKSSWLLVILGQMIAFIIAPLGAVVLGVGLLFTTAYAAVAWSHLLGQAYLNSVTTGVGQ